MTTPAFEAFLARLYADRAAYAAFLRAPRRTAQAFGLSALECDALERIDRVGLELAHESFAHKRRRRRAGRV
jgi:hypothetical protein